MFDSAVSMKQEHVLCFTDDAKQSICSPSCFDWKDNKKELLSKFSKMFNNHENSEKT